jgi:hypothetical protein
MEKKFKLSASRSWGAAPDGWLSDMAIAAMAPGFWK